MCVCIAALQGLEINEADSEKEKERKRKAIKKIKNEKRFQEMDTTQKNRQMSWQNFQKGKGKMVNVGWCRQVASPSYLALA